MKTNQIGTQYPLEESLAPRQNAHQLLRRERHVPEYSDRQIGPALPHQPRRKCKMEILDPKYVTRPRLFCRYFGKITIYAFVAIPMLGTEVAVRRHEVHQ